MRSKESKKENPNVLAIPAGAVIGAGVGFFLLPISGLYFVGSILCGLGLGFIMTVVLTRLDNKRKEDDTEA